MSAKTNAAEALRTFGTKQTTENREKAIDAMHALFEEQPSGALWGMILAISLGTRASDTVMNRWADEIEATP